jgi:hypothetical protein
MIEARSAQDLQAAIDEARRARRPAASGPASPATLSGSQRSEDAAG